MTDEMMRAVNVLASLIGKGVTIPEMDNTPAWIKDVSVSAAGMELHIYYWIDGKRQDCWVFGHEVKGLG